MNNIVATLDHWFTWVSTSDRPPAPTWSIVALAMGAALAVNPKTWNRTRLFATYIHEAGHAILAIATGRRVTSMHIKADSSGSTEHFGVTRVGPSLFLTALAGYPAPALVGLAMMFSVSSHHPRYAIATMVIVILGLALVQHSLRGWAVTLIALVVCAALILIGGIVASEVIVLLAGYLLIASPRTIINLHRVEARRRKSQRKSDNSDHHSDAAALAAMTGLGVLIWEIVFLLICMVCIWQVFRLL